MTTRPAGHQPSLNGLDRQVIAQAASMLPGNWYLDPVIDLQHSGRPRVWIRSSAFPKCNGLAVSFERRGMSVWMALQDPAMDPSNIVEDLPFDTVLAAFIYLKARLLAQSPEPDMDAPVSGNEPKVPMADLSVAAAPAPPIMHPRILERIMHVALARKHDMLLGQLDRMIDRLDQARQPVNEPLSETLQAIRHQLLFPGPESAQQQTFLDQIHQEIIELQAELVVFNPVDSVID